MCGIVGLYLKNPALNSQLGALFEPMLLEMTQRGPDSTGFALYRDPVAQGEVKVVMQHPDPDFDWAPVRATLEARFGTLLSLRTQHTHCLMVLRAAEDAVQTWLLRQALPVAVVSVEQLYPWPFDDVARIIDRYSNADEIVWLQEEPENMGAWNHIKGNLFGEHGETHDIRRASRRESASPAAGASAIHAAEARELLEEALGGI